MPSRHVEFGVRTTTFPRVEDVAREVVFSGDPLTDAVSRVLVLPLRELYAVLWRAGVVHIVDRSAASDERQASNRGTTPAIVVATAAVESA